MTSHAADRGSLGEGGAEGMPRVQGGGRPPCGRRFARAAAHPSPQPWRRRGGHSPQGVKPSAPPRALHAACVCGPPGPAVLFTGSGVRPHLSQFAGGIRAWALSPRRSADPDTGGDRLVASTSSELGQLLATSLTQQVRHALLSRLMLDILASLSRPGARFQRCRWPVSPGRSPNLRPGQIQMPLTDWSF
jgi:hypothetical protein